MSVDPSDSATQSAEVPSEHTPAQGHGNGFEPTLAGDDPSPLGRDLLPDSDAVDKHRIVGRYRLLRELGKGGFGVVWQAEQTEPIRREVALKVIKAGMDSADIIARFEAERQTLALMDHPNIASVLDAGTAGGRPYFVMELVKGVPITDYCDQHRLTVRQRLELFILVCSAVQHAHQKAILHRDLKPSNILVAEVDGKPVPKVIDFGIAKALAGAQNIPFGNAQTLAGMVMGTPRYMSPEQAVDSADMDTRGDIYSLGVILYELLTGDTPLPQAILQRAAFEEVLRQVREVTPARPSSRATPVTAAVRAASLARGTEPARLYRVLRGDLDWITLKTLEKERERRYESATALAQDLDRYLRHEPVKASPPSRVYLLRKLVRRHRVAVAATSAIFILLLVGVVVSTAQARRAARAEMLAIERLQQAIAEKQRADAEAETAKTQTARATKAEALAVERLEQAVAEKKRADGEADTAKAVNEFLQMDLLRQAGSYSQSRRGAGAPNPDLTVRDALDRAATTVDSRFRDRPLVEAAIRATLGDTYLELGVLVDGRYQLEQALQLRTRELGPEHLDTLILRASVAEAMNRQGESAKAEEELRALLALHNRLHDPENPFFLRSRMALARSLTGQGKYAAAEVEYRALVVILQKMYGAEHSYTLENRMGLALALANQQKYAAAESEHREILVIMGTVFGPEHPSRILSQCNLALALNTQGRNSEAEEIYREILPVQERLLGAAHPHVQLTREGLGLALAGQGRHVESEPYFRQALSAYERLLGSEHADVLRTCYNLAFCLEAQGRRAEALELARTASRGHLQLLGKDSVATKKSQSLVDRLSAPPPKR